MDFLVYYIISTNAKSETDYSVIWNKPLILDLG